MNERLKGDPGNLEAWDLGLPMGHFSVIPGHLLSLAVISSFWKVRSQPYLSSDILGSVEDTVVLLSSPFASILHSPGCSDWLRELSHNSNWTHDIC